MAEKSWGYRPGLFLGLGLALSSFSYSKRLACSNHQKEAAGIALAARVSGGSAPRRAHHWREGPQGWLGINWSEQQAGSCLHLENYPS